MKRIAFKIELEVEIVELRPSEDEEYEYYVKGYYGDGDIPATKFEFAFNRDGFYEPYCKFDENVVSAIVSNNTLLNNLKEPFKLQ